MDAFTRELGTRQGRFKPSGLVPAQGDYVFCLGFDGSHHSEELVEGDFCQATQTATFDAGARLIRVTAVLRPPSAAPAGLQWVFSLRIDGHEAARHVLTPGALTRTRSLSANVSKASGGTHEICLRLQLRSTNDLKQYVQHAGGIASGEAVGAPTIAFDPSHGVDCAEFYIRPNYALVGTTGTFTATIGNDLAITNPTAPTADAGAPVFAAGVTPLQNADTAATWRGDGECYQLAVVDIDAISTMGTGAPWYAEGIWSDVENGVFLLSVRKEAGPTYFADYATYDSAPKIASVEITSYVDAFGAGRVTFQTKQEAGFVWIRANNGSWVQGDAVVNPASFQTNTMIVGRSLSPMFQGKIRALGFFTATQADVGFADLVPAWGAAL